MFGPNKNIDEWRIPQNEGISLKTGDKTSLNLRESYPSKQGDTKDTIQKKERQDKNTMPEQVQAMQEKAPSRHEETDKAFESIFWCAGMRKTGKKNAASAFRTQFRDVAIKRYCNRNCTQDIAKLMSHVTGMDVQSCRRRVVWCENVLDSEIFFAMKREIENEFPQLAA